MDLADGLRLLHGTHDDGPFDHMAHLRFCWAVLEEAESVDEATSVVSLTIRHAAELGGTPDKYHETVTVFWVRLVDHVRQTYPGATTIEELCEVYPDLTEADLASRHWSNLEGEARTTWIEPDLIPMP
jgi:hypothetical protein